ncbi:Ig-like domain-containing protein [Yoonia sp. 2307UL14-13]|uniref:Ig-like domain-containing protein n=1 Tax=Yoonia sp. 2307UL14-13 TaxID=3126506 RepID=UPI0030B04F5D
MEQDFSNHDWNTCNCFSDRLDRMAKEAETPVQKPAVQQVEGPLQFFLADVSGGVGQQEIVAELTDGAVIDPALLEGREVTIFAINPAKDVGSVRLFFQEFDEAGRRVDARFKVENVEPFALFGDNNGDFRSGLDLDGGTYSLYFDAFSGDFARGNLLDRQTINFTVAEPPAPVNNAPVAVDDAIALANDESAVFDALANDRDPDGDALTLTRLIDVTPGLVATIRDGRIAIDPNADFSGDATILYEVSDGNGGTSQANVSITVDAPPPPPDPEPDPVPTPDAELSFFLVDIRGGVGQQRILAELTDGAVIDADLLGNAPVTIFATTDNADLESVRLSFSGQSEEGNIASLVRVENFDPYTLFGDNNGDFTRGIANFGEGSYTVGYEAFDADRAQGQSLGGDTINFTVVDRTPAPDPDPDPAPDPDPTPPKGDPFENGALRTYTSGGERDTSFNIDLVFDGPGWTVDIQRAFVRASEFLSSVIIGDTQDTGARFGRAAVDDIQINVDLENIDGRGGTLAFAGPRATGPEGLTSYGGATFDTADLAGLSRSGALDDVIVHEFYHALGFGTLFRNKGLLENNRFTGEFTTQLYNDEFPEFSNRDGGSQFGLPTQRGGGHFDEGIFGAELNTPSLNFRDNFISGLSIAALEDLGYDTYLNNPFDANDLFGIAPENTITGNDLFVA